MDVVNQILVIFQDLLQMINHLAQLGTGILAFFGVPKTITIGTQVINTVGLFSLLLTILLIGAGLKFLSQYAKYIVGGGVGLLILSIIATFI
jgi:hypothetical protein